MKRPQFITVCDDAILNVEQISSIVFEELDGEKDETGIAYEACIHVININGNNYENRGTGFERMHNEFKRISALLTGTEENTATENSDAHKGFVFVGKIPKLEKAIHQKLDALKKQADEIQAAHLLHLGETVKHDIE